MDVKHMALIDVGGTKTDAVMLSSDGCIISHVIGKGGIPFDHGLDITKENITSAIRSLMSDTGIIPDALYASVATAEYYEDELYSAITEALPIKKIRIEGDGPCLISGMLGHTDGCAMICGTGSSLYMRTGDDYCHIGGGGQLVDSCGSGFRLGSAAFRAALRATDGSSYKTVLCELLTERNGGVRPWEDQETVYRKGRAYIASFADCVFKARDMGDVVARRIFSECASDLADVVWGAYKKLGTPFKLVLNGGIMRNYPEYAKAIIALSPKEVTFIMSDVPPVYGCAVEAMHDLSRPVDKSFKSNFLRTYKTDK